MLLEYKQFTEREWQLINSISEWQSMGVFARGAGTSVLTTKVQLHNLYKKIGVRNLPQLGYWIGRNWTLLSQVWLDEQIRRRSAEND